MSSPESTPCLLQRARWNPYGVGAGIGLLCWAVFYFVDKPLGVTTALTGLAGACASPLVGGDVITANAYFKQHGFKWDYGMLFLGGIGLGGLLSALLARSWRVETVPEVWRARFGPSTARSLGAAFLGGVLIMFGARLADGAGRGRDRGRIRPAGGAVRARLAGGRERRRHGRAGGRGRGWRTVGGGGVGGVALRKVGA